MKTQFWVYGTLKRNSERGHWNHKRVGLDGEKFLGYYRMPNHRLFGSGIPFLVPDPISPYTVEGEVWEVGPTVAARILSLEAGYLPTVQVIPNYGAVTFFTQPPERIREGGLREIPVSPDGVARW